jgi:hypothetical protein
VFEREDRLIIRADLARLTKDEIRVELNGVRFVSRN